MSIGIVTAIHAVLLFLLLIEAGLTGYVVSVTTLLGYYTSPPSFAFMLFNSIWSPLVLLYLAITPLYLREVYNGLAALGLLVITTIFWFAGSIAMATVIGVNCHGNSDCQTVQAAVAFGFFIWAIFAGLTALEGLATMRGGGAQADKVTRSQPAAAV